jgi:heptosyltransferase-3
MGKSDAAWSAWHERTNAKDVKILIIQRDNIGDMVLSTPFFRALHEALPSARIDVVANSYNAPVLAGNSAISTCYAYTKLKHRRADQSRLSVLWASYRLRAALRANQYDLAIVMGARLSPHGLRLARSVKPRHIAAFAPAGTPADGVDLLIDPTGESEHPPRLHRVLLERLVQKSQRAALPRELPNCEISVDAALRQHIVDGEKLSPSETCIAFHISARKVDQRWGTEAFAELMHRAHKTHSARLVLLWAPGAAGNPTHPGDDEKAEELLALTSELPVIARATHALPELVAALSVANVVVCSDGGAMHVAAALQKPLVAMFGNSDPAVWQAWGTRQTILRDTSHKVEALSVDMVEKALNELIQAPA